jgi:LytS/YehU family sensor histidine kinase
MDTKNPVRHSIFTKMHLLVLANVFFWVSFAIFDILSSGGALGGYYSALTVRFFLHAFLFSALVYPNLYYLYPRFFSRGRYLTYILLIIALIVVVNYLRIRLDYFLLTSESAKTLLGDIYNQGAAEKAKTSLINAGLFSLKYGFLPPYYLGMTIGTVGVFFITSPIRLIESWFNQKELELQLLRNELKQKQNAIRIREEKLKFLKAQTDPHFLINAISGVYHLALLESKRVDHALLRLSELMGYLLGYGKEDVIALRHEIAFVENYLDFNTTIYQDEFEVTFQHSATPEQMQTIVIPPMLLQPFFENAFKYGSYSPGKALVNASLEVRETYIRFNIENTYAPSRSGADKPISYGIGIRNVQERLKLFLPDQHTLHVSAEGGRFKVELVLFIHTAATEMLPLTRDKN